MTTRSGRRGALALLCAANFLVILDAQVVVLAVPAIERDLALPPTGSHWVLGAYLLSFGGLLLLGGRVGDLVGRRRMFLAGTGLFLLASLGCGLAWTGDVLIAARVLQGASAAVLTPSALAILTATYAEGRQRNRALAIWSGTGGFGATAALLIGGGLTAMGWEWIFFLNVPVAAVMLACGPVLLRETSSRDRDRGYDVTGAVLITAAATVFVYGIVETQAVGWTSVVAAVLVGLFVLVENRSAAPLVPLRSLRWRTLGAGSGVVGATAMAAFGMSLILSHHAQQVWGYSPAVFGAATAALPVMAAVGSYAAQACLARYGARPVAVTGAALLGAGLLLLAHGVTGGGYAGGVLPGLVVFGFALGASFVAGQAAALTGIGERDSGLASGMTTAAFQLGGAIGVAALTAVASSRVAAPSGDGTALLFGTGFALLSLLIAGLLPGRPARLPTSTRITTETRS